MPILIDTRNQGFHLTDPRDPDGYVTFRFGDMLMKVSWPDWRYDNAWLVYDKNGVIDGADDLFGNFTPHSNADYTSTPNNADPTGFLAALFYDQPSQGGNGDTVFDKQDAVWKKLKLWKPKHCHLQPYQPCVALDSELFTLESQGIHALSLVYMDGSDLSDDYGNACTFKAVVNPDIELQYGEMRYAPQKSRDGRYACDFNLVVRK